MCEKKILMCKKGLNVYALESVSLVHNIEL